MRVLAFAEYKPTYEDFLIILQFFHERVNGVIKIRQQILLLLLVSFTIMLCHLKL